MVRISDAEGSHFEAPVDVVWKYVQHPDAHAKAHKGSRNRGMTPLTDASFVVSWEQEMDGKWIKVANRITVFPPLGMVSEALEGPLAGSKMFTVYTPKGENTEVSVFGEFQSPVIPHDQLEKVVRAAWEGAFKEDSEGVRDFHKGKK